MEFLLVLVPVVLVILWLGRTRGTADLEAADDPCLECGYDLRFSKIRCPECGAAIPPRATDHFPLRDDWPATPITPRAQSPGETPTIVRSTTNLMEARLIQDQLNARGIACWISNHKLTRLIGYSAAPQIEANIMVWSEDEATARELLDRLMQHRDRSAE